MKRFILGSLAALAVAFASNIAPAVTHTWNGGTASMAFEYQLARKRHAHQRRSSSLTLIFPNGPHPQPNQDIASPISVESLQFATGSFYQVLGNGYQMNNLGCRADDHSRRWREPPGFRSRGFQCRDDDLRR